MGSKVDNLLDKPFDQYSRQKMVYELATKTLGIKNAPKTKIIDLGGHKGITNQFFDKSEVTILDVYDEHYEGYIKGDATNMTFADEYFDLAVSFDVLEHIDRKQRKAFISEAVRVSKFGAFIAAPIDNENGDVAQAEIAANDAYKVLHGRDHAWLREHIDYKIPSKKEIDAIVESLGFEVVSIPTNDLQIWSFLQTLTFVAEKNPEAYTVLKQFEVEFNQRLQELDTNPKVSYRRVYFIAKDKKIAKKVTELANSAKHTNERAVQEFKSRLQQHVLGLFSRLLVVQENKAGSLEAENNQLLGQINDLQDVAGKLNEQIKAFQSSLSWKVTKPLRSTMGVVRRKEK